MKQSHLIALNTFVIWGTTALQMIPPLILVPFVIRHLGESGYGEYALIWSLLMAIETAEQSLQSGVIKYTAGYLAQNRIDEVNKVLSSTFVFSFILGLLSCLAIISTAFIKFDGSQEMSKSLILVGIMMIFLVPTTPYQGIVMAKQRHYLRSLIGVLVQYSGLIITIGWFRWVKPSMGSLIVIMASTFFIGRIAQVPLAYRLVPGLKNQPRTFDWVTFRMVASFGMAIIFTSLCVIANSTGMRWLTGILVSTNFVAHLAILLMPALVIRKIITAMTITLMPATSAYLATNNLIMLGKLFLRSTRYVFLLVVAGFIAFALLIHDVITLWIGASYDFLAVFMLVNLSGASILMSASCAHQMLKGFGKLRQILFAYFVGQVAIPVLVFLAVFLAKGSPYVAVTAGLTIGGLFTGIVQLVFCLKSVKLNYKAFVINGFIQPILSSLLGLGTAICIVALIGIKGLAGRVLIVILAELLIFLSFYFLFFDIEERKQIGGFAQMVRNRFLHNAQISKNR